MNERLRKMIRFGILQRTVFGEKPPVEVEYRLTPFGLRFMRIIEEVRRLQEAVDQGEVQDEAPKGIDEVHKSPNIRLLRTVRCASRR
jgi:DNA-binding HxlR family transcriptional regulator